MKVIIQMWLIIASGSALAYFALMGFYCVFIEDDGYNSRAAYLNCHEDEVFTYIGDFPEDVSWVCVPLDELK